MKLTDSNHLMIRPPRTLVWALVMYVRSLTPPAGATPAPASPNARARADIAPARSCRTPTALR